MPQICNLTIEEETKERFRLLQEDVNHGIELKDEDKAFYEEYKPKYGYKPRMEQESIKKEVRFGKMNQKNNRKEQPIRCDSNLVIKI